MANENASPEDPVVHVARSEGRGGEGNDVVERVSELQEVGEGEKNEHQEYQDQEVGEQEVGQKRRRSTSKKGKVDPEGDQDVDVSNANDSTQNTKAKKQSTDGADVSDEPPSKKTRMGTKKDSAALSSPDTTKKALRGKQTASRGGAAGGKRSVGRPRKGSKVDQEVQTERGEGDAGVSEGVKAKN